MRTSMFCIVACFVINANASPAPEGYFQGFKDIPPGSQNAVVAPEGNDLADKYAGGYKFIAGVWQCINSSSKMGNELSCTGPGGWPATLTLHDTVVDLDLTGLGPFRGNIIEKPDINKGATTFDFGPFIPEWVRQATESKATDEKAIDQEVPLARAWTA